MSWEFGERSRNLTYEYLNSSKSSVVVYLKWIFVVFLKPFFEKNLFNIFCRSLFTWTRFEVTSLGFLWNNISGNFSQFFFLFVPFFSKISVMRFHGGDGGVDPWNDFGRDQPTPRSEQTQEEDDNDEDDFITIKVSISLRLKLHRQSIASTIYNYTRFSNGFG